MSRLWLLLILLLPIGFVSSVTCPQGGISLNVSVPVNTSSALVNGSFYNNGGAYFVNVPSSCFGQSNLVVTSSYERSVGVNGFHVYCLNNSGSTMEFAWINGVCGFDSSFALFNGVSLQSNISPSSVFANSSINVSCGGFPPILSYSDNYGSVSFNWSLLRNGVLNNSGITTFSYSFPQGLSNTAFGVFRSVGLFSGFVKGDNLSVVCRAFNLSVNSSVSVQNSLHIVRAVRTSPLNVSLFESFVFQVNVSDVDNDVLWVNLSVRYPNGSVVLLNTSLSGGLWESVPLVGYNGSWLVNVSTDDGVNSSYAFSVSDLWYVSPPDYAVLSAGENLSYDLSFITGSLDNLSFSASCVLNSSFFNCSIPQNFSVINSSLFPVSILSSIATPDDVYYGNLSFTRLFDGRVYVLPLTVGVQEDFGVPVLLNDADWSVAVQSSASVSHEFELLNNGTYPLSACFVSFDQSLQFASFYSILPSNFSVPVNASTNFTLSFSNPPLGLYQGQLNVLCVASGSGVINSLAVDNRPSVSLFSYPVYSGGSVGGGGGGSPAVIVVQGVGNETLFTVETDAGAVESFLYMYPAQTRVQTIILRSGVITDQSLSITCSGVSCKNVVFDKSAVKLSGKQDAFVFMNITVPQNTAFGSTFDFDVTVADASSHSALLRYHIEVSRLSSWYSKFGLFCREGDSCLWVMLGSFGVPKLVLYLLLLIPSTLLVLVIVPDPKKNKAFKDVKPLLYIIVDLAVLLIASVLI